MVNVPDSCASSSQRPETSPSTAASSNPAPPLSVISIFAVKFVAPASAGFGSVIVIFCPAAKSENTIFPVAGARTVVVPAVAAKVIVLFSPTVEGTDSAAPAGILTLQAVVASKSTCPACIETLVSAIWLRVASPKSTLTFVSAPPRVSLNPSSYPNPVPNSTLTPLMDVAFTPVIATVFVSAALTDRTPLTSMALIVAAPAAVAAGASVVQPSPIQYAVPSVNFARPVAERSTVTFAANNCKSNLK